jgi:predicted SnoaL-like aldol condensation-catalyzing enzyme
MTAENHVLASRFFEEVFNQGKLEVVDELFDSSHVFHFPALPEEQSSGVDVIKDIVSLFFEVSRDFNVGIEDEIAQEDKTVVRWVGRGSLSREMSSAISTDDRVTVAGCNLFRIEDDVIRETWLFLQPVWEESEWPVLRPEIQEQLRITNRRDDDVALKFWCLICPWHCHEPHGDFEP